MTKKVLLIIASKGFQPIEYHDTKKELEDTGYFVTTASDKSGKAISSEGKEVDVDLAISEVDPKDYDGIFIIGGPGAIEHLDNMETWQLFLKIDKAYQLYGAICIATRILANVTNMLSGKYFTGWNSDNKLAEIADNVDGYYAEKNVVVDGNLITAAGPKTAKAFGQAIVTKFKNSF